MESYLGTITLFGFNFAPRGWLMCQGQLLSIAQNTALFSLLGTMYGGNGQTTFGLPDLRGRVPIGMGQGPGLSGYVQGQLGGTETTTLTAAQLPSHQHSVPVSTDEQTTDRAQSATGLARGGSYASSGDLVASGFATSLAGSNQPFSNVQPYLGMNWCICVEGIYPSRPD